MAENPPWPLGSGIPIESTAHKTTATVTCVMDNTVYKYKEADYNWAFWGVDSSIGGGALPQAYINHKGTDIQAGRGSSIYAISSGEVVVCGGTYHEVYIRLDDDTTDAYLHMDIAPNIYVGKKVSAGELIGYENGWGGGGASAFPPHLHLDKFITSVGRGRGTIDSFNYAQGKRSSEGSCIYMKVDNLSSWDTNSDKIGLWIGDIITIKKSAPLFWEPKGTRAVMKTLTGEHKPLFAWQGEFGENMKSIAHNLVGDKIQVSVYDNFGAFHPNIWVNIRDVE